MLYGNIGVDDATGYPTVVTWGSRAFQLVAEERLEGETALYREVTCSHAHQVSQGE